MMARTRNVNRSEYRNYLQRAGELINSMKLAYEAKEWNACVINDVQSAIASADALCVFTKGLRHAGDRHDDAIILFASIDTNDTEIRNNAERLEKLLSIKTDAEYGEKLMKEKDDDNSILQAERLFSFVKSRLPG